MTADFPLAPEKSSPLTGRPEGWKWRVRLRRLRGPAGEDGLPVRGRAVLHPESVEPRHRGRGEKPGRKKPWTETLWVYDLRANKHFTLKTNPLKRGELDEFVACYLPENRHQRKATWSEKKAPEGRWRAYGYDELLQRDKVSLDIF